jgi:hypothetical protein
MPIIWHRTVADEHGDERDETVTRFAYKPNWFVYLQTEGAEIAVLSVPGWDRVRALEALGITEVTFASLDGNTLGYAKGRTIAISPFNPLPYTTTFHELAHALLGHTGAAVHEGADLARNLREVEAEAVALICCEALGLEGAEYARGYIQSWLRGEAIPDASAQRILQGRRSDPTCGSAMIALGYTRRSKESGERTVSLEDQRERITAYCHEDGWHLIDVLIDDGVSGGRRERLRRLADRVRGAGAGVVVVYHLDRFCPRRRGPSRLRPRLRAAWR